MNAAINKKKVLKWKYIVPNKPTKILNWIVKCELMQKKWKIHGKNEQRINGIELDRDI